MDKIKRAREELNTALETMENLNNEYKGEDFPEDVQEKYDNAKATAEAKSEILKREKEIENAKMNYTSLRNDDDGEKKELEKYSFRKALNYLNNPNSLNSKEAGFYKEMHEEGTQQARNNGVSLQGGGLVIPSNVFENAVDVATEGSDVLFDKEGGFINALRDKMVLAQLGVRYLSNLSGDVRMPKQTQVAPFSWEGETTEASGSDTAYGSVTLAPKRGFSKVDFSNQMLAQESLGMERLVRDDIFNSIAHGIESAAINASTANGPNGILDIATAVNSVGSGSGDLYRDVVNLEKEVTSKNVFGEYAYLLDSSLRADAKTATKDAGSGRFVWEEGNTINGYKTGVTNAVTANQLIFGDFSQLVIGDFSGVEILRDPYTQAASGVTRFITNVYVGTAIRHDEAFAYVNYS